MSLKDSEILNAIRTGKDDKSLEALYDSLFPKIRSHIRKNKGNEEEAKDIFQDALLIFYRKVKTNDFDDTHSIGAYVFTIAKNLWINRAKKIVRNGSGVEVPETMSTDNSPSELLVNSERSAIIMNMLNQLGARCKELLIYTFFYELSMKEVCEKMGFATENAAKTRNYKCKQRLMELVKDNELIRENLKS